MAQQKGIIFYPERIAVARGLLDDAEIGQLFLAVCDYAENGTIPDYPSKAWGVCFELMRGAIDKSAQKYAETCARNREKANKRWNNQRQDTTECNGMHEDTNECTGIQTHADDANLTKPNLTKPNYSSEDNSLNAAVCNGIPQDTGVYDGIPPNTKGKRSAKRFTPPTVDDVRAYCEERGNHVDAQRFVDFYTANGWKVGKNSMKDWKAAVRTWERSDSQQKGGALNAADPYAGFSSI